MSDGRSPTNSYADRPRAYTSTLMAPMSSFDGYRRKSETLWRQFWMISYDLILEEGVGTGGERRKFVQSYWTVAQSRSYWINMSYLWHLLALKKCNHLIALLEIVLQLSHIFQSCKPYFGLECGKKSTSTPTVWIRGLWGASNQWDYSWKVC
jgi:hypothetical protein